MKIVKTLMASASLLFVLAISPAAHANDNPFAVSAQSVEKMQLAGNDEAKCGKAKCGEGKCGDAMKKGAKDGKCGEGKCGANMKDDTKMKCGPGKCGDSMKKAPKEGKCGTGTGGGM